MWAQGKMEEGDWKVSVTGRITACLYANRRDPQRKILMT